MWLLMNIINNCRVLFQTIAIYFLTNKAVYLEPGWYNPGVDLLKNILKILILRMLSVGRIFHIPNIFFLQYRVSHLAVADRNMQVRFGLKVVGES